MKIDDNGNYILFSENKNDIDYLISQVVDFNNLLNDMLRREPYTRKAIMDSRYKDLLCLRVQISQTYKKLLMLKDRGILHADEWEMLSAASEHPETYGND